MKSMTRPVAAGLLAVAALSACNKPSGSDAAVPPSPVVPDVALPVVAAPVPMAPFAEVSASAGGICSLDNINGAPPGGANVHSGEVVTFSGWVVDGGKQVPVDAQLLLKGTTSYAVPMVAGAERPDVAEALASDSARLAGYNLSTRLDGVGPASYALSILFAGTPAVECLLKSTLVVSP